MQPETKMIERRNTMSLFVFMKDHVLSLPTLLGISSDTAIAANDNSVLRVLR